MNITQILDACTGCGVCAAVCPSAAVEMQPDAHGFLRPAVSYTHLTLPTKPIV